MLSVWFFFICSAFPLHVFSQDLSDSYAKQIDSLKLKEYLYTLTSDSLAGRETGTAGQIRAAAYLANDFFADGLAPLSKDTFQYHPLSIKANKHNNLEVNGKKFLYGRDYFALSSNSPKTLSANVVFTLNTPGQVKFKRKYRHSKAYSGLIVLTSAYPLPENLIDVKDQLGFVAAIHPVALCITVKNIDSVFINLRRLERTADAAVSALHNLPFEVIFIGDSVSQALSDRKAATAKALKRNVSIPIVNTTSLTGCNVPFMVKGSVYPNEVVLVTAHYDHLGTRNDTIFRGADDDASGTSTVLELARVFSSAAKEGHSPKRSILFMPVSGEEKGLLGSSYYAQHPLVPLENTVANLNIDMVGRTDPKHDSLGTADYVYIIGDDKLSSQLHEINSTMNERHVGLELDYRYNAPDDPNRFYFRSDHYNFAKNNIPVSFYFNGTHADYHKSTDTPDKINFTLMQKRARLIFHTLWELANRDQRITVDRTNDMEKK